VLCKYALLHTSISCYTGTVTSTCHIAVRHTPCGVIINKDTSVLLHFQFSVLCLQDKMSSSHVAPHFMCVCVCLFPWGLLSGGDTRPGDIFKVLHLTETGTQSTKRFQVAWFVCVPGGNHFVTPVGEGTVKGVTPVSHEEQTGRYWDCRRGERKSDEILPKKMMMMSAPPLPLR